MKRPVTILGGIFGVLAQSLFSIIMLVGSAMMITQWAMLIEAQAFEELEMIVPGLVGVLIFTALTLVTLLMNAIALSSWKKNKAGFKKRRGFIVSAIVLNFILCFVLIGSLSASNIVFMADIAPFVMLLLLIVTANVLYIVDLAREKNKVEAEVEANEEANLEVKGTETFVYEVEKVYALKKKGLLSDEDYKLLKKHYIKNFTK